MSKAHANLRFGLGSLLVLVGVGDVGGIGILSEFGEEDDGDPGAGEVSR